MQHPARRARRRGRLPRSSASARRRGTKLVCFNERFARPGVYEVPLRDDARASSARTSPAGSSTVVRSRRCRSAARWAGSCRAGSSTPRLTSTSSPPRAACSATAGSSPSTTRPTCARLAIHLLHFGAAESCGKCFPCRIGLRRALEMFAVGRSRSTATRSRRAARDARARQPLRARRRDAGADPQPAGSTFQRRWDWRHEHCSQMRASTARRPRSRPARRCSEAVRSLGGDVPTLCFDERLEPFGACRVCMVGVAGARGPVAACTTPCRDGMGSTRATRPRGGSPPRRSSSSSPSCPRHPPRTPSSRSWRARFEIDVDAPLRWPGEQHVRAHDERHPYLALQHELCISCGRCVRACDEIQGTFALTATGRGFGANIAAGHGPGLPRVDLRVVRRVRRHLSDRRDHRDLAARDGGALGHARRALRPRRRRPPAATAASAAASRRTSSTASVVSISPALDGPANKGHTCLKGRFAHSSRATRDRLRTPLIRNDGRQLPGRLVGRGDRARRLRADADPLERRRRRDRRPRLLAGARTRTATSCSA